MHAGAAEKGEGLEDVDSLYDLFQEAEEQEDKFNYDYDDYVDESMWGDKEWTEERHEKMEEYINIDSHILCTLASNLGNYNTFFFVIMLIL